MYMSAVLVEVSVPHSPMHSKLMENFKCNHVFLFGFFIEQFFKLLSEVVPNLKKKQTNLFVKLEMRVFK